MSEEREKVRCQSCELVQWSDRTSCRRCGSDLPKPVVTVVERVVQRVVIRHDPECIENLEKARRLILAATERLMHQPVVEPLATGVLPQGPQTEAFPTMAEVERAAIVAAYRRSNRKPLEAARLLGIGKMTLYRKLREIRERAA